MKRCIQILAILPIISIAFVVWMLGLASSTLAQPMSDSSLTTSALIDSSLTDFEKRNYANDNTFESQTYAKRHTEDALRAQAYHADSVQLRTFDAVALATLRMRDEFIYNRTPPAPSIWKRLEQQLSIYTTVFISHIPEQVFYVLSIAIMIFLVLTLMKADLRGLFYGAKTLDTIAFQAEDLLSTDELSQRIEDAISKREYRHAVRYLFLRVLKELAAHDLIVWRIDKTNRDYVHELRRPDLKVLLADLARLFEYVWYGNFEL
ncbi:MAG: DUF4129 domain-containing protein, partial [Candidatus Thermochlorobacter sp.]